MNEPVPPWLLYQLIVSRSILTGDPNGNPFPPTSTTVAPHRPAMRPRVHRRIIPPVADTPAQRATPRLRIRPRQRLIRVTVVHSHVVMPPSAVRPRPRAIYGRRGRGHRTLVPVELAIPGRTASRLGRFRRLLAALPTGRLVVGVAVIAVDTSTGVRLHVSRSHSGHVTSGSTQQANSRADAKSTSTTAPRRTT